MGPVAQATTTWDNFRQVIEGTLPSLTLPSKLRSRAKRRHDVVRLKGNASDCSIFTPTVREHVSSSTGQRMPENVRIGY